ncbi:LysM peptidoglycan-binding domain-containing protein [Vulgatibacter incomptus]|uniref:LysM domain-containing protein n=1 Tax=Vulgatibacter incomptus TaxID=1391653 RepID=A0A0K1PD40_9BACT|nr:LysM peptidoglycan-binding domain-containing protein [Vulgatibacter incomptus]AKU91039.1 hypothetical protein AKJ08_1426 [Vulgatibacter incomptus]
MNNFVLRTLTALVVALPAIAFGAEPEPADEASPMLQLASDPSARDFGGAVGEVEAVPEAGETVGIGNKHVVEKGDTLWDLSEKVLGSPWSWPKVWSYNPQIENPHWIYPGDEINFGPNGQGGPAAQVRGEGDDAFGDDDAQVSVAGKIGFQGKGKRISAVGFASEDDVGHSGRIVKSWEEKELLYQGDKIYIDWENRNGVRPGQSFVIFRTERAIAHPSSGVTLGYVTRILGSAKVVDVNPEQKVVTAVIERSIVEISRGDFVGPSGLQHARSVARAEATRNLTAIIAGTLEERIAELAQGHFVILDKGYSDGIEPGNSFNVIRATDGLDDDGFTARYDEDLPAESIGELLVVDARGSTSVAVVTRSLKEMRQGDRAELRAVAGR